MAKSAESSLCCGSAGTYNITQPEMATRLQQRKVTNALSTEAEVIAMANTGCAIQLMAGLQKRGTTMRVMHIVEILDAAYRQSEA